MLQVQCPGCMTQVFLECTCPPGYVAAAGQHQAPCTHADIDAQVTCDPASDSCCHTDHDHAAAANACPGNHGGQPCPDARNCRTWKGAIADAHHPMYAGNHPLIPGHVAGTPVPACPGGHCHKDVPGCTVCRPLIITIMPGTTITPAGA